MLGARPKRKEAPTNAEASPKGIEAQTFPRPADHNERLLPGHESQGVQTGHFKENAGIRRNGSIRTGI